MRILGVAVVFPCREPVSYADGAGLSFSPGEVFKF
jgi:hypothetical protein